MQVYLSLKSLFAVLRSDPSFSCLLGLATAVSSRFSCICTTPAFRKCRKASTQPYPAPYRISPLDGSACLCEADSKAMSLAHAGNKACVRWVFLASFSNTEMTANTVSCTELKTSTVALQEMQQTLYTYMNSASFSSHPLFRPTKQRSPGPILETSFPSTCISDTSQIGRVASDQMGLIEKFYLHFLLSRRAYSGYHIVHSTFHKRETCASDMQFAISNVQLGQKSPRTATEASLTR